MNIPRKLNTPVGRFVQIHWDGDPLTFKAFLEHIGSDFFTGGWGYEPATGGITVPTINTLCFKGTYLCCAIDRPADAEDRYSVSSIDITEIFKRVEL